MSRRLKRCALLLTMGMAALPAFAEQGQIRLVSRVPPQAAPETASGGDAKVSADNRFVAFSSIAPNLVPRQVDRPKTSDVFLYDRLTNSRILVSHVPGAPATVGNQFALLLAISADGNWVLFYSPASDLVEEARENDPALIQLYLFERATGKVTLVSRRPDGRPGNGISIGFALSADGSSVAFWSRATDLTAAPLEPGLNVYLFERASGAVTLVSHAASSPDQAGNDESYVPALSADGRFVAYFSKARNLVAGQVDPTPSLDLFLYDRMTGANTLVTHANASALRSGNNRTDDSSAGLSADGRFLVYAEGSPARAGDGESTIQPDLSADGSLVVYASAAGDLDATKRDSNLFFDTFVYEQVTKTSRAISLHTPGVLSRTANSASLGPAVSGDGRYVAYLSFATNLIPGLVDRNDALDVFLYDRETRKTILVSRAASSPRTAANAGSFPAPQISRDGSAVLFSSKATDLVAGQHGPAGRDQLFLFNRKTGITVLVSRASSSPARMANGDSYAGGLSADGGIVAFSSVATDLVAGQKDRNERADVFVYDLRTATVTLASHIAGSPVRTGDGPSGFSSMSLDGGWIGITSYALNLTTPAIPPLPGPYGGSFANAYLFQRQTGAVTLISQVPGPRGPQLGGTNPVLSADARYVAWVGDGIRLLDRATGKSVVVVRDPDGELHVLGLSDDGSRLLFDSYDAGIVPGQMDANDQRDLFLFDAASGKTRLVSHVPGSPTTAGVSGPDADSARLSADGRRVVFISYSPDMLAEPPAPGAEGNVFRYDAGSEEVDLVSHSAVSLDRPGDGSSYDPRISAAGDVIVFTSYASDLVAADFNFDYPDVFVFLREEE